jgi:polyhydroxyalkanoate synthesis regulator phasin
VRNMKTWVFMLVFLCICLQAQEKVDQKAVDQKEAERIEKLVEKLVSSGKLLAEQVKLNTPKRLQKNVPAWIPPQLDIRDESLAPGMVGFVEDIVFVDEVLSETKFRATIYVRRQNASQISAIVDNHSTKGYTDKKKVKLNSAVEIGTEKTAFGETLLVFKQVDIPMEKIKAAVLAK